MSLIDQYNFEGKRALVRVDFNVPLHKETLQVTDDTRITAALPTIHKILNDGGSVVLMSHLGRPKNGPDSSKSLQHIITCLSKHLNTEVQFADDCISERAFEQSNKLKAGEVLLLENTRFYYQEETKGDDAFAQQLAQHGEVYVNDAFGTAHRAHASTTIVANYFASGQKLFGYLMANEIASADKVLADTKKPFVAIIGGAKVSDKLQIIQQLLAKADQIIIGGGMAYTFIKAQGGVIGNSLVELDMLDTANALLVEAKQKGVELLLPIDSIAADAFSETAITQHTLSDAVPTNYMGLDIGPKAVQAFTKVIQQAKTILWNGPMGVFEMGPFQQGTASIAQAVAVATKQGAFSLVGGGDSVAAVKQFELADQVSYISTGGGAMLEYFEGKVLPGIAAISAS